MDFGKIILEDCVKRAADTLDVTELRSRDATSSFFYYGMVGLLHEMVCSDARRTILGSMSSEQFFGLYNPFLRSYKVCPSKICVSLLSLSEQGIFMPKHVGDMTNSVGVILKEGVELFDPDYRNMLLSLQLPKDGEQDYQHILDLRARLIKEDEGQKCLQAFRIIQNDIVWNIKDLITLNVAENGILLGKYMWQISVASYYDVEKGGPVSEPVHPETAKICRELIQYYSKIIDAVEEATI